VKQNGYFNISSHTDHLLVYRLEDRGSNPSSGRKGTFFFATKSSAISSSVVSIYISVNFLLNLQQL